MVRDSLEPGARQASLLVATREGLHYQWRLIRGATTNGFLEVFPKSDLTFPLTLRLIRRGPRIIPEYSRDGGRRFETAGPPSSVTTPSPARSTPGWRSCPTIETG